MDKRPFTTKQQRFIDFYDGNATDAARKAGYKQPELSGHENIRKHKVLKAILDREKDRNSDEIMSREERQKFWTEVARGEATDDVVIGRGEDREIIETRSKMADRLKASEHLGRSEADFTDKHIHDIGKETAKHVYGHLDKKGKGE